VRSAADWLGDIVATAGEVQSSTEGLDGESFQARFSSDIDFRDALSFRLMIIGEAVAALLRLADREPARFDQLAAFRAVDWEGFVGMRNVLAHQYFRRDPHLLWTAIHDELPALRDAAGALLAQDQGQREKDSSTEPNSP
jgi:uncharacterized protein with HEPN domain